ncbi:hypothetical protein [Acetivibrio cellulolyticus]|uniref:hypothetical protein n=1 Tax=Acetivibrio cellulolyticus TaxID=35830 RepID=UPI0001E305BB|nr:hypothetical protein [Acetivibrio cellulolyticus]
MAESDIRLDNEVVIIKGATLKSETCDFNLDNYDRRIDKDQSKLRRALVHDQQDGLTINYDQDYPGGVTIRAVNKLEGDPRNPEHKDGITVQARVLNCQGTDIQLDCKERHAFDANGNRIAGQRRALVHDFDDSLVINYGHDYPRGVKIKAVDLLEGNPSATEHADSITVKARVLNCKGTDIILDCIERHPLDNNGKRIEGQRRALVHDTDDNLTLNYLNDYTGGVKINGEVSFPSGKLKLGENVIKVTSNGASIDIAENVNVSNGKLEIRRGTSESITFAGNEIIVKRTESNYAGPYEARFELVKTVRDLQNTVMKLQNKVTQLEAKLKENKAN